MADEIKKPEAEEVPADPTVDPEEVDVELDDEDLEEISDRVEENLAPKLQKQIAEATKNVAEDILKKVEPVVSKAVKAGQKAGDEADDPVAKGVKAGLYTEQMAKESKEMRLFKAARALGSGDFQTVGKYNAIARATREKAGYANTDDTEDGGALVPDAEFDTTVYENLPKYGVAFADADVRQTDRNSVRFLTLDSGLQFYATAEAGVKTSAKLQFSKALVELQKYAVIVPSTDELADDAAIDFWNLVTRELARAYARVADEVVFTDATSGITNTSGVLAEAIAGAGTTVAWSDLLDAQAKTEDDLDESGAKWYMRKETWYRLVQTRGTTNDHYLAGSLNTATGWVANPNQPTTPWGTPVVFTRVLPTSNSVSANDAFAVYGDLSNYVLYNKRGLAITMLREATILDSESAEFNLATQDGTAMRAVIRLLGKLPKGNATKFVVLGTGTVS